MKTNSLFKRLVSMLIVVLMICTVFPVTALAEDYDVDNFDWLPTYTYTIKYDTQGGSSVDPTTVTSNSVFYRVPVTDQKPSKDGFIFLGWATESNATAPNVLLSYYTLYSSNPTVTLYAVWRDSTPSLDELNYILDVKISCLNATLGDPEWFHTLIGGTYTIGKVTGNEADGYTCTVTINSDEYIEDYSATRSPRPIDHELAEGESPSKTVTLEYGSFGWRVKDSWSGTAEINFYVVHKKTYTLSYDANGGSGAPDEQETETVNVGQSATLTISSTEPTRQGYDFKGWATTKDAIEATHKPSGSITITADTTLYAVWEENQPEEVTYTLTYDANDGSTEPFRTDSKTNREGKATFTIITDEPTRVGYTFKGWAETANATAANVGASYTLSSSDPSKTLYAVWEKNAPTYDELNRLFGNSAVTILCTNTEAKHNPATYGLLPNSENENDSYSISKPQKDEKTGLYTCDITVKRGKYIDAYNGTYEGHTADENDDESKTITLKYQDDGTWAVKDSSAPVTFNVVCVVWNNLSVHKDSTTTNGIVGTVIPGEEITYTITVKNETGKDLTDIEVSEVLNPNLTLKSISPENANYKNGVWTISSLGNGDTATLTIKVQVSREVADGTEIKNTATIRAAKYGTHSLPGGIRPTGSSDVKVKVPYTVTYTDGVADEEVFKDQVYSNLFSGDSTPAYNGGTNPTRYGYVFAGWYPTVEATVSGNATYKATWKEDINHNGIADEDEDKYTVRYTDGVYGVEIFKDEVYGGLLFGTRTPLFQGSLTRRGYVFTGWRPVVSGTVTGDATYIATWRKVKDTTVIEIGGGNSSSSSKEENPNTGAPVFVGVSVGALAAAK